MRTATMASGIVAEPYVIRAVVRDSGEVVAVRRRGPSPTSIDAAALSLIQEGLRGVVRLPTGTAHALASRGFPIAVMGKTGTTNEFRDAIFVGSTYGPDGITAAVRIGFDDNRSLGSRETGGRLALPVFQELMLGRIHATRSSGPRRRFRPGWKSALRPPCCRPILFPRQTSSPMAVAIPDQRPGHQSLAPGETDWLLQNGMKVQTPIALTIPPLLPR